MMTDMSVCVYYLCFDSVNLFGVSWWDRLYLLLCSKVGWKVKYVKIFFPSFVGFVYFLKNETDGRECWVCVITAVWDFESRFRCRISGCRISFQLTYVPLGFDPRLVHKLSESKFDAEFPEWKFVMNRDSESHVCGSAVPIRYICSKVGWTVKYVSKKSPSIQVSGEPETSTSWRDWKLSSTARYPLYTGARRSTW